MLAAAPDLLRCCQLQQLGCRQPGPPAACTQLLQALTWCTETMSPSFTRRFFLTTLLILILASSTVSSDSTMQTVSLRFLPCSNAPRAT